MAPAAVPGASTGGKPPVPAAFGLYEVGRSWLLKGLEGLLTAPFRDTRDKGADAGFLHEETWRYANNVGDPGKYHPYFYEDSGTNPMYNSSCKNRKPFDSTEVRDVHGRGAALFGLDTPSVGAYPVFQPDKTLGALNDYARYKVCEPVKASFTSTSLQRPTSKSDVPGPGTYTPNVMATYKKIRDAGAQHRSKSVSRFEADSSVNGPFTHWRVQTPYNVGPADYDRAKYHRTLQVDCEEAIGRLSKLKPGFGTTSAQRGGFAARYGKDAPGPGAYEPFYPRKKFHVLKEFAHVQAVTDNLMDDEEAAVARAELAAKAKAKRKAKQQELSRQNMAYRQRMKNTAARTDDDVSDDATGAARRRMAAESAQRKAAEAAALEEANASYKDRVRNTAARTDDEMDDEAAAVARGEMARASAARKKAEAAALAAENEEYFEMVDNAVAKTNDGDGQAGVVVQQL